jgi:HEAT repeat protein
MKSLCFAPVMLLLLVSLLHAQTGGNPKDKKKDSPEIEGLKALKHPDAMVRYRAADTLGQLGPTAKFAVPELRELLKDKNAFVRVKAAEALWKIEQTSPTILLPILLQAMNEKDARVRAAAPPVIALLGKKAKTALPALVEALKDSNFDVKLSALSALDDLGPVAQGTVKDLLELTSDKDFVLLEPFLGAALANLGKGVVPDLAKAVVDKSPPRRRVAAYALGSLGPQAASAAPALAQALKYEDAPTRKKTAWALGKIGKDAKKVLPQLEAILGDKDPLVRIEAALATWQITGETTHIGVLISALKHESVNVRDIACQALAEMKVAARDAVEPLTLLLPDKDLRIRAIITLGEIGSGAVKAVPELNKFSKDKDTEAYLWSTFAIWQITRNTKETLSVLVKGLELPTHDKLAIRLLGEMGEAAQSVLQTLVGMYREEEDSSYRLALAEAIKKIDPKAAMRLGIR